jgi:hypothetical protein
MGSPVVQAESRIPAPNNQITMFFPFICHAPLYVLENHNIP